jgi:acyl dehydratase
MLSRVFSSNVRTHLGGVRLLSASNHFWKTEKFTESNLPIAGEMIINTADLTKARPGDVIEVPYEMTITNATKEFWQSAFYSHDRINTSTPYARSLGLQDQPIPFSLMTYIAASMSHADDAKIDTSYSQGKYHWPAFAGDTFRKKIIIQKLRNTSDGNLSVVDIYCEIMNQRDVVVYSCVKSMMFPFKVPASKVEVNSQQSAGKGEDFKNHLVKMTETLEGLGSQTHSSLKPGQLILHTLARPLTLTHTMQLATLGRLTHPRHFNTRQFKHDELVVPGGLVLGMTTSLASRDLHEVLYEELFECAFPNETAPGDCIGAMTFILEREEHVSGEMESLIIRTIGIKNVDIVKFAGKQMPNDLFTGSIPMPKALEEMLKKECPELNRSIICICDRKIYRQTPKETPFLL